MLKLTKEPFAENRYNYILTDTTTGLSLQIKPSFARDYKILQSIELMNAEKESKSSKK